MLHFFAPRGQVGDNQVGWRQLAWLGRVRWWAPALGSARQSRGFVLHRLCLLQAAWPPRQWWQLMACTDRRAASRPTRTAPSRRSSTSPPAPRRWCAPCAAWRPGWASRALSCTPAARLSLTTCCAASGRGESRETMRCGAGSASYRWGGAWGGLCMACRAAWQRRAAAVCTCMRNPLRLWLQSSPLCTRASKPDLSIPSWQPPLDRWELLGSAALDIHGGPLIAELNRRPGMTYAYGAGTVGGWGVFYKDGMWPAVLPATMPWEREGVPRHINTRTHPATAGAGRAVNAAAWGGQHCIPRAGGSGGPRGWLHCHP